MSLDFKLCFCCHRQTNLTSQRVAKLRAAEGAGVKQTRFTLKFQLQEMHQLYYAACNFLYSCLKLWFEKCSTNKWLFLSEAWKHPLLYESWLLWILCVSPNRLRTLCDWWTWNEMKTWIKWKQDNSETQNVNWIIKNITYGDVSNINIVQNYEFEDEKTETQQPQIHLYLSVIIGATMSVMCSQTVTVLFFYVFFTRKWGSLKSHIALTLISPQAFIFTDSWLPRESRNDTYFSDLVHACVWMRACVCENLHIWMCAYTGSVCVGPRDCGGTRNRVWLSAAANWIGDVRKTMTQLPRGLFYTVNWTE